jgi:hypothetical protein
MEIHLKKYSEDQLIAAESFIIGKETPRSMTHRPVNGKRPFFSPLVHCVFS